MCSNKRCETSKLTLRQSSRKGQLGRDPLSRTREASAAATERVGVTISMQVKNLGLSPLPTSYGGPTALEGTLYYRLAGGVFSP